MLYSYIALNAENQKLKGVINALDESGAKKKLHNVGLSVLSLREADEKEIVSTTEQKNTVSLPSFTFFVIDPQGKKLSGSIESIDRKNALRRLVAEYGFEVLSLCESSVSEDLRYKDGQKGLKDLEEEVEYEFGITMRHSVEGKKESEKDDNIHDEDFEIERKEILKEIEMVSKKTQEILKKHRTTLDTQDYTDIEKLLGDLIRLRFSNNFALIRKLIESLFEKIGSAMKKELARENKSGKEKNYDEMLQEEKLFEEMQKSSGSSGNNDVLSKLKKFSSSLDSFLAGGEKKKRSRPSAGVFTEAKEDFTFFKRTVKSGITAFLTSNTALRSKRIDELKHKIELWKTKKMEIRRHQDQEKRKKEFEERKKGIGKESEIFFFLLDELRMFGGALISIILVFAFVSSFIIEHNIDFERVLLEKSIHSPSLISFTIGVFFFFFVLVVQKIFFKTSVFHTLIFFITMGGIMSLYFINL